MKEQESKRERERERENFFWKEIIRDTERGLSSNLYLHFMGGSIFSSVISLLSLSKKKKKKKKKNN